MKKAAWMGMLVLSLGGCANTGSGGNGCPPGYWQQNETVGGPFSEFGLDADDMRFRGPMDSCHFGPLDGRHEHE